MPGKYNICIAWEILHILFGTALTACSFWKIDAGMILYDREHPEYDTLSLDRKNYGLGLGYREQYLCQVCFGKKYQRVANNNDDK